MGEVLDAPQMDNISQYNTPVRTPQQMTPQLNNLPMGAASRPQIKHQQVLKATDLIQKPSNMPIGGPLPSDFTPGVIQSRISNHLITQMASSEQPHLAIDSNNNSNQGNQD